MTEDVVSYGDDRPPRRRGGRSRVRTLLAGAAAVAVLGAGVAGALRSPGSPGSPGSPARPSPTPSRSGGWTEYPGSDDPFAVYVSAHRPDPERPTPLLLEGNVPAFLLEHAGDVLAVEAIGGPPHAPALLGWCAENGAFQDATGAYRYVGREPAGDLPPLRTYPVRPSAGGRGHVDIGLTPAPPSPAGTAAFPAECEAGELLFPPLPERRPDVFTTAREYGVVQGRYVVTTESRAFCPTEADAACDAAGWETYGPHTVLPPGDLASAYTWEGDFLVRTSPTIGALDVVLTRGSRLVRRERVGAAVRVGWVESFDRAGGRLRLAFNPFRRGDVPDDSPPGPPRASAPDLVDERGGLRRYVVRPDAEVYLGVGVTGLGRPRGTPATLEAYLRRTTPYADEPLWLVLDERGRVLRAVLDPGE